VTGAAEPGRTDPPSLYEWAGAAWLAEIFGGPGSRLAVENSGPDAHPVRAAPVPRWGWGVAPPYPG
jgi:hypothetical protein